MKFLLFKKKYSKKEKAIAFLTDGHECCDQINHSVHTLLSGRKRGRWGLFFMIAFVRPLVREESHITANDQVITSIRQFHELSNKVLRYIHGFFPLCFFEDIYDVYA
jgi:hypothetical protein